MGRDVSASPRKGVRYRRHANPFNIRGPLALPDWRELYGRDAPFALDVGFGAGAFPLELARRHPEWNVLGIEIRQHLVDELETAARAAGLGNLHGLVANANLHIGELVPDRSLVFVSVNFPDPWYKKRHRKRRVLRPEWLDALAPKMRPDAELHVMTDFEPIALEALAALTADRRYVCPEGDGFLDDSTTGVQTEREAWHLSIGERVYRLRYRFALASAENGIA
jgi:tRNA (guanine-N7-)-methyltransferase